MKDLTNKDKIISNKYNKNLTNYKNITPIASFSPKSIKKLLPLTSYNPNRSKIERFPMIAGLPMSSNLPILYKR